MLTSHLLGCGLLAAVSAERLVELWVSRRHGRILRARGAVEAGRGHYPPMIALHTGLLLACAIEPWLFPGAWPRAVAVPAAALVLLSQALRWWVVATLGVRWSTRVLVLPGATPVKGGPYRWVRHPNYLAVVVEVAALPLACGAWRTAICASLLDAALLRARIRAEERALGSLWAEAFRGVPRLLPGGAVGREGLRDRS
ncbi:MAG TPA: isoprenylcysteine carboxylmethyltransferase family protein [Anaeromyxobacter sp.]|nr:isoprenylcysteine carboxylmethyltransferase family protein [Anaeromyxobacter sp.]